MKLNREAQCPICSLKESQGLKHSYYDSSWGVEEEFYYCPRCEYSYEYSYGNYIEYIGHYCFMWHYSSYSKSYFSQFIKKNLKELYKAKRNWKKFKHKTTGEKIKIC